MHPLLLPQFLETRAALPLNGDLSLLAVPAVVKMGYYYQYPPLEHALGPPGRASRPTQGFFSAGVSYD